MSGISINTVSPNAPPRMAAGAPGRSYGGGSLSRQQLDTLRAAVGHDFVWPPTPDSGTFPLAAALVAHNYLKPAFYAQQLLTEDGLKTLAALGALDAAGVARGVAFLRGDRPADDTGTVQRPAPGTVAPDGSMYL